MATTPRAKRFTPPDRQKRTLAVPTDEQTSLLPSTVTSQSDEPLPPYQQFVVIAALAWVQLTYFIDQTAIAAMLPTISRDLRIGLAAPRAGTSFLVANTCVQLISGQLSDIFGRKTCLLTCLIVMGIGNLGCGFVHQPLALYAARAATGIGAGAINALVQVALSNTVSLKRRGKYQGVIIFFSSTGSALGPLVAGLFIAQVSWRWVFFLLSIMELFAATILYFAMPQNPTTGGIFGKLQSIDWLGVVLNTVGVILVLVPLSLGGSDLSWSSPIILTMLVVGILLWILFLFVELRIAKKPMIPMHIFSKSRSVNILLSHNFVFGWVFYVKLYYTPLYFQDLLGWDATRSGILTLPRIISHIVFSIVSGFIISATSQYWPVLISGAAIWIIPSVWLAFFDLSTPIWQIVVQGILEGFSMACGSAPVLIALLALSDQNDHAMIPGLRSFVRIIGGAIGTTVSSTILNNVIRVDQGSHIPTLSNITLATSLNSQTNYGVDLRLLKRVQMKGFNAVFSSCIPLIMFYFTSLFFVEKKSLELGD